MNARTIAQWLGEYDGMSHAYMALESVRDGKQESPAPFTPADELRLWAKTAAAVHGYLRPDESNLDTPEVQAFLAAYREAYAKRYSIGLELFGPVMRPNPEETAPFESVDAKSEFVGSEIRTLGDDLETLLVGDATGPVTILADALEDFVKGRPDKEKAEEMAEALEMLRAGLEGVATAIAYR